MTIIYILSLVAIVYMNAFLTGLWWDEIRRESTGGIILRISFYSIFGFILIILAFIVWTAAHLWEWLGEVTQCSFWYHWHFTDKYKNLSDERLEEMNKTFKMWAGIRKRDGKKLGLVGRHYIHCIKVIRKKYPREYFNWVDNKENFIY